MISSTSAVWGTWQFWVWVFSLNLFNGDGSKPTKHTIAPQSLLNLPQPSYWSILESLNSPSVSKKARLDDPLVKSYLDMLANLIATELVADERCPE